MSGCELRRAFDRLYERLQDHMADSGVGRRHMIEASFFPNAIPERAPDDQPHHQFDALGSGVAEIFYMRYTGETVCIARQVVEKRLVEVAVDQAGPRPLKLVAHPSCTPYLDIEVIREALGRFPEGRAKGVATRPSRRRVLDDIDC